MQTENRKMLDFGYSLKNSNSRKLNNRKEIKVRGGLSGIVRLLWVSSFRHNLLLKNYSAAYMDIQASAASEPRYEHAAPYPFSHILWCLRSETDASRL